MTLKGGYNATYSTQSSETFCRSLTVGKGKAVVDKVTLGDTSAPADVASVVFYNDLVCGGDPFSAIFTIGGETFTSVTGQYSSCEEVDCGKSLSWTLQASPEGCSPISWSGSKTLTCNYLYEFYFTIYEGEVALVSYSGPGACSDVPSSQMGEVQLLDVERISKDAGLRGFESLMAPFISK